MNILFICAGNTCRSPMAAAIFAFVANETGRKASSDSAGLSASPGQKAAENAVAVVREFYDADLSDHRSKPLTKDLVKKADLILCMTKGQQEAVQKRFPGANVDTIGHWASQDRDVDDPYGGDLTVYRYCARQIENLLRSGIRNLSAGAAI
jgi:protein-tyrosine-phosphatase